MEDLVAEIMPIMQQALAFLGRGLMEQMGLDRVNVVQVGVLERLVDLAQQQQRVATG
jgi:hypothetical protein